MEPVKESLFDECSEDEFNLSDEDLKHVVQNGDVTTIRSLGMAHRYLEGGLVIILHIRIRGISVEEHDGLCATVYRRPESMSLRERPEALITKATTDHMFGSYIQQPMLVSIIEKSEKEEERRELSVPSVVRLNSLDHCLRRSIERAESAVSSFGPFGRIANNRELDAAGVRGQVFSAVSDSHSVGEMIKGRTQVVNAVPDDQGPSIEGRWSADIQHGAVPPRIDIELFGDDVGIAILPLRQFSAVEFQVSFGMADLQEGTSEFRTDHALTLSV